MPGRSGAGKDLYSIASIVGFLSADSTANGALRVLATAVLLGVEQSSCLPRAAMLLTDVGERYRSSSWRGSSSEATWLGVNILLLNSRW